MRLVDVFGMTTRSSILYMSKEKSKFNLKGDAAREMYLSRFEEEILSSDKKTSDSNLTNGERNALYLLHDDPPLL